METKNIYTTNEYAKNGGYETLVESRCMKCGKKHETFSTGILNGLSFRCIPCYEIDSQPLPPDLQTGYGYDSQKNQVARLRTQLTGGESSNICQTTGDNVFECDCYRHRGR